MFVLYVLNCKEERKRKPHHTIYMCVNDRISYILYVLGVCSISWELCIVAAHKRHQHTIPKHKFPYIFNFIAHFVRDITNKILILLNWAEQIKIILIILFWIPKMENFLSFYFCCVWNRCQLIKLKKKTSDILSFIVCISLFQIKSNQFLLH